MSLDNTKQVLLVLGILVVGILVLAVMFFSAGAG